MSGGTRFDAAVVAGGRSRRLGTDKAFLDWRGVPLYVAQLRKLASLAPERLWLSTRGDQAFPEVMEGVARIVDETPGLGPLGGLRSILAASEADRVLVLAVDLPKMEASFLSGLLEAGGGAVPRSARGWEPLAAVYPRVEMLPLVDDAITNGRLGLQGLLDAAETKGIVRAVPVGERESEFFANLNTPEDLAAIGRGAFDEAAVIARYRTEGGFAIVSDRVAVEEPLEIRVNGTSVAVTMRTPGHDDELAIGFLLTEGVLDSPGDIDEIVRCPEVDVDRSGNVLDVRLRREPDLARLTRHVFTSSSCGICGKATIDAVFASHPPVTGRLVVEPAILLGLPAVLRAEQATFDRTGGLHASALFDAGGRLLLLREDVGRHNALDKVLGGALSRGLDTRGAILLVSGRVSFELMQKALVAGIPFVAGISAPSSLAVDLARRSGQTLVGFLRERSFNVYAGGLENLTTPSPP